MRCAAAFFGGSLRLQVGEAGRQARCAVAAVGFGALKRRSARVPSTSGDADALEGELWMWLSLAFGPTDAHVQRHSGVWIVGRHPRHPWHCPFAAVYVPPPLLWQSAVAVVGFSMMPRPRAHGPLPRPVTIVKFGSEHACVSTCVWHVSQVSLESLALVQNVKVVKCALSSCSSRVASLLIRYHMYNWPF